MTEDELDKMLLEKTAEWGADEKQIGICQYCGAEFPKVRSVDIFCSLECKKKNDYEQRKTLRREAGKIVRPESTYIVLKDPIRVKQGGFRPGTIFDQEEMEAMAKNHAFEKGTLIYSVKAEKIIEYTGE